MMGEAVDREMMALAARLACRGAGRVSPNPPVGCVIVDRTGRIAGQGWHARYGEAHAEVMALNQAGNAARGGTAYVTLEPCNHHGKTPPCAEALLGAGVARCVIARHDPDPKARGGAVRLREAGIAVDFVPDALAIRLTDPFVKRVTTGLPWVVVKWAQSLDGRIATRERIRQWISSPASRSAVHRRRARADVIMTGIGTVIADDPMLTARHVRRRARLARRVIYDPGLETPVESRLVATANEVPTLITATNRAVASRADACRMLGERGVKVLGFYENPDGSLPLTPVMKMLASDYGATNVFVEAGGGLVGRLISENLVDQIVVYVAPMLLGDDATIGPARGLHTRVVADAARLEVERLRRIGPDIEIVSRVLKKTD